MKNGTDFPLLRYNRPVVSRKGALMSLPPILAHGALGGYDEIIFVTVGVIFVVMMAISWLKSRNNLPEDEDTVVPATPPDVPAESPDRYRLK